MLNRSLPNIFNRFNRKKWLVLMRRLHFDFRHIQFSTGIYHLRIAFCEL